MPYDFRFDAAPFDCLTPTQRAQVAHALRPVEFAARAAILTPETPPEHAYLLISGHVQLIESDETVAVYGPKDLFAVRALMAGRCSGTLQAMDAVRAWSIPAALLRELIRANTMFSAKLFSDLSRGLSAAAQSGKDREFLSLMMVRIADAFIRKPLCFDDQRVHRPRPHLAS